MLIVAAASLMLDAGSIWLRDGTLEANVTYAEAGTGKTREQPCDGATEKQRKAGKQQAERVPPGSTDPSLLVSLVLCQGLQHAHVLQDL